MPQLTEIKINGFLVTTAHDPLFKYKLKELPENLCKQLCEVTDQGDRYSASSRYTYSFNGVKAHNDIRFGTAKAAVYYGIKKLFGDIKEVTIFNP